MGLGPYPVISIEYARKQAHQNQILLYEGEDPLALKQKSAQDKQQSQLKMVVLTNFML